MAFPARRRPPALSALLLLAAAGCASGLYAEDGPVAALSSADVLSGVVAQERAALWVVEFTVEDGCAPCKSFAQQFSLAVRAARPEPPRTCLRRRTLQAEKLRGLARFGSVDCSSDANKDFCAGAGLRSLPAVKLYPSEARVNPYKPRAGLIKLPTDFAGEPTARGLSDAVTAALPYDLVLNVSSAKPDWRAQLSGELPLAVLFTEKAGATALYRALSLRFRHRMRLALARADDAALSAAFGVTAAPALVVQVNGELVRYDGELKAAALTAFLEQHAAPAPAEEKPAADGGSAEAVAWQPLALRNATHFESAILGSEKAALVAFAGGQADACAAERETWRAAARALDGQVTVAEADAGAPWAARYAAAGRCFTIVRFAFGSEKADLEADADVEAYPADEPVQKGPLGAWALESVPDFVQFVTASTAQPYFGTAAHLPKLVLVSEKAETPAMFRALAANFHGRVQFARTHIKDELAANMRVAKAPAVRAMLVPPGAKPDPDGTLPLAIQEFFGPLRYDQLAMFCEAMVAHTSGGLDDEPTAATSDNVVELADDAALHSTCEARGGLCLVAVLDSRAAALQAQLAQLRAAASRQRATAAPVHFCWVDLARHASFAAAFDVATSPSAFVLSAKKLRYAPLRIAFSTDGVTSLVDDVLAGRVSTVALSALPRLVAGDAGSAAAANAEPAEEVEEEFDLSDIMGENVDDSGSREARLREAEQTLKREAAERAAAAQEAAAAAKEEAARAAKAKKKKRKAAKKQAEL